MPHYIVEPHEFSYNCVYGPMRIIVSPFIEEFGDGVDAIENRDRITKSVECYEVTFEAVSYFICLDLDLHTKLMLPSGEHDPRSGERNV